MSKLPDLHQQAMVMKNKRRLRYDGGRAWIKNGQLHEAVKSATLTVERNPERDGVGADRQLKPFEQR